MPLNDSIRSLANATVTLKRTVEGTWVDGVYQPAAPTTTTMRVVMQPAFNLNRVIGGADLNALLDNQSTFEVNVFWTTVLVRTREAGYDPDVITYKGKDWTAVRCEEWDLTGEVHYKVVITRKAGGAA